MSNYNSLLGLGIPSTRSGLETKFNQLRQNIELTQNQIDKIKTSHSALRATIENLSYIQSTFLTGSYKKSTMIRPPYDVDIFVVLMADQASLQPQTVLDKLKRDISAIPMYSKSTIRQDHPCVVVDLTHCKFELTPVLKSQNVLFGGYQIPQKFFGVLFWTQIQDPNIFGTRLSQKNAELENRLIPLIKMMKKCKAQNDINDIKSFQMEEKAVNELWSISSSRDGVQKLMQIYGWSDSKIQNYHLWLSSLSDNDFATYCRNSLFGTDFPI